MCDICGKMLITELEKEAHLCMDCMEEFQLDRDDLAFDMEEDSG